MPRTKKKKSPAPSSATLGAAAAALRAHEPDLTELIQGLTVASVRSDAGRHCAAVDGLLDEAEQHLTDASSRRHLRAVFDASHGHGNYGYADHVAERRGSLTAAADSLHAAAQHAKPHLHGRGVSAFAKAALRPGGNAAKLTPRLSREEYARLYRTGKLDRSAPVFHGMGITHPNAYGPDVAYRESSYWPWEVMRRDVYDEYKLEKGIEAIERTHRPHHLAELRSRPRST